MIRLPTFLFLACVMGKLPPVPGAVFPMARRSASICRIVDARHADWDRELQHPVQRLV